MRICVEGSIGCGKTTCLRVVERALHERARVFFEPLHKWERWLNCGDALFAGFAMQMAVLMTFVAQEGGSYNVFERSPQACTEIFAHTCLEQPEMDLFREVVRNLDVWRPDHIIYVRTPPEVCYARMKARGRLYETHSLEFLQWLHRLYEAEMGRVAAERPGCVTVVDGTMPAEEVGVRVCHIVSDKLTTPLSSHREAGRPASGIA